MIPPAPAWTGVAHELACRIRPGVRIRALRLDARQWAEYEAWLQSPPQFLWGYPVVRR